MGKCQGLAFLFRTCCLVFVSLIHLSYIPKPVVKVYFPKSIVYGDSAVIRWKTENLPKNAEIGIDSLYYNLPVNHKVLFYPKETKKYIFRVEGKKGTIKKKTMIIEVRKPAIDYFFALRIPFTKDSVKVFWSVRDARQCSLSPGNSKVKPLGSSVLPYFADSLYMLLAKNKNIRISSNTFPQPGEMRQFVYSPRKYSELEPGSAIRFDIVGIDRSGFPGRIVLKALAADADGNAVTGLAPPSIPKDSLPFFFPAVLEKQDTSLMPVKFALREINGNNRGENDLVFVLDYSGSTVDIIEDVEGAVMQLISAKSKEDRLAIVRFDDQVKRECNLLADPMAIMSQVNLNGLKGWGGPSALYAAMDEGIKAIAHTNKNRVMILFTDGIDDASLSYFGTYDIEANEIAKKLKKFKIKLICLAYGSQVNHQVLREMTRVSDGIYYELYSVNDLYRAAFEINYSLKNYYEVSYSSSFKTGSRELVLLYNNLNNAIIAAPVTIKEIDTTNLNAYDITWSSGVYDSILDTLGYSPVMNKQVVLNFLFDSAKIEPEYYVDLKNYMQYLRKNKEVKMVLFGHADLKGTVSYNQALSQKRADRVKDYFVKNGLDTNRVVSYGLSNQYPLWKTEEKDWMAKENRRVEAVFCK